MGLTVSHSLSATTPSDPAFEIQPKHWNSNHIYTLNAVGSEISGAFGNGGGITFGLSADGNITAVAPAAGASVNFSGGTTSQNLAALKFVDSNGLAFGLGTGGSSQSLTGSYTQSTHSHATEFLALTLGGNTAGTTTYNASNTNTIFLNGGNNITLSGNAGTITISGPTLTNSSLTMQAGASTLSSVSRIAFVDSNGVSFGASTSNNGSITITATVQTNYLTSQSNQAASASNGSFTFQTVGFSNANNVTFGTSAGSIVTASVAATVAQTNQTIGFYATGNTTQNSSTTFDARTAGSWNGIGAATIGFSNGSVQLSVPATSSIVGADGISVSTAGSTISVRLVTMNAYEPLPLANADSTTYAPAAGTWYLQPLLIPFPISGGRWNIMVAHGSTDSNFKATSSASFATNTTGSLSVTGSYERRIAFYSIGAGANSTRLESITSMNWPLSFTHRVQVASAAGPNITVTQSIILSGITSINSAGATTQSTFSTAGNSNSASASMATSVLSSLQSKINDFISSQLMIPIPFNTSLTAGQYYVGFMWNSTSGSTSTGAVLGSNINTISVVNQYAIFGNTNTAARLALVQTNASSGSAPFIGVGFYSASSASPPSPIVFADIRTTASQPLNYINYVNSTF